MPAKVYIIIQRPKFLAIKFIKNVYEVFMQKWKGVSGDNYMCEFRIEIILQFGGITLFAGNIAIKQKTPNCFGVFLCSPRRIRTSTDSTKNCSATITPLD